MSKTPDEYREEFIESAKQWPANYGVERSEDGLFLSDTTESTFRGYLMRAAEDAEQITKLRAAVAAMNIDRVPSRELLLGDRHSIAGRLYRIQLAGTRWVGGVRWNLQVSDLVEYIVSLHSNTVKKNP